MALLSRGPRCRQALLSSCLCRKRRIPNPNPALTTGAFRSHSGGTHTQLAIAINNHPGTGFSLHRWGTRMGACHNQWPARFSTFTKSTYVHPLSQIVLEHLQSNYSDWVKQMGLDTALKLNKDGTFVLRFPDLDNNNSNEAVDGNSSEEKASTNGSIWTMYEPEEKKHYLCVRKGGLVGRYMLQDNTKPAWHSDKRSTPERVQDAVDEMIAKIHQVGNAA